MVFGNIFVRKKWCVARLAGIKKSLADVQNPNLVNLEEQIRLELLSILDQEASYWKQNGSKREKETPGTSIFPSLPGDVEITLDS